MLIAFSIQDTDEESECLLPAVGKNRSKRNMTSKNTRSSGDDDKRDHQERYVARVFLSINTCHLDASFPSLSQQHFTVFQNVASPGSMLAAPLAFPKLHQNTDMNALRRPWYYQKLKEQPLMSSSSSGMQINSKDRIERPMLAVLPER